MGAPALFGGLIGMVTILNGFNWLNDANLRWKFLPSAFRGVWHSLSERIGRVRRHCGGACCFFHLKGPEAQNSACTSATSSPKYWISTKSTSSPSLHYSCQWDMTSLGFKRSHLNPTKVPRWLRSCAFVTPNFDPQTHVGRCFCCRWFRAGLARFAVRCTIDSHTAHSGTTQADGNKQMRLWDEVSAFFRRRQFSSDLLVEPWAHSWMWTTGPIKISTTEPLIWSTKGIWASKGQARTLSQTQWSSQ